MNNMIIYENIEFGKLRTVKLNDEVWFVGKDVADALGYSNTRDALATHISEEDKNTVVISDGNRGNPNQIVINESGLYALILGSKLESSKRFKHWVTSEILPSIRKNGGYIYGQDKLTDDELLERAVLVARKKIAERDQIIQRQQALIEENRPKAIFADAVSTSKSSILIGDLAKIICQNGYSIGQKRLFRWMRENGYLVKSRSSYNMPMQRYIEQGLFEIKESHVVNPDGSIRITKTPKVTGKGQIYFINKFLV